MSELDSQGLPSRYDPVIPDNEPLRDWGVCSTTPSAGQDVDGPVVLHIGHFACGGGSNSAAATGSTPAANDVKAAWHQVTVALARQDGTAACADMTAEARHEISVTNSSSCEQAVRTQLGFYLNPGDVRSVASVTITGVAIQGDRATVYYDDTNGLDDLDGGVSLLGYGLGFADSSDMQRVGGKWLLAPSP